MQVRGRDGLGNDGQGKQQEALRRNREQIADPGRCTQLSGNLENTEERGTQQAVETKTPGQAARIRHVHICTEKWVGWGPHKGWFSRAGGHSS